MDCPPSLLISLLSWPGCKAGARLLTPQTLREKVLGAYQNRYVVAIHALGDKAVMKE